MERLWLGIFVLTATYTRLTAAEVRVTSITPRYGGAYGQVLITIYGSGFAPLPLNDDPKLGNRVFFFLPGQQNSYECDIHPDGCDLQKLTCFTRRMPFGSYYVRLKVNNVEVPGPNYCTPSTWSMCIYMASWDLTPKVAEISPRSGPPGTLVTLKGTIMTSFYANTIQLANSTNGITEKIIRVYMGGKTCELIDPSTNKEYKILLDGPEQELKTGTLQCLMQGTYVGYQNMSFIVSGVYGRSMPDANSLLVSLQDRFYHFQTYAEIISVSPVTGSERGGTRLTVTGKNFDATDAKAHVKIDGQECEILDIKDKEIVCLTPAQTTSKPLYPGNRGLVHEMWPSANFDDVAATPNANTPSDAIKSVVDDTLIEVTSANTYVGKVYGFFVSDGDSEYRFSVSGAPKVKLSLSTSEDPAVKVRIAHTNMRMSNFIGLKGGQSYYIELIYDGVVGLNKLTVAAQRYNTTFTGPPSGKVRNEVQHIKAFSESSPEIQTLKLTNWPAAQTEVGEIQTVTVSGEDTYRLGMDDIYTGPLNVNDDAKLIQAELNQLPTIYPDTVTVTSQLTATSATLTVTFNSKGGTRTLLTVEYANKNTASAVRTRPGVPSNTVMVLDYNGLSSQPIPVTDNGAQVKSALEEMFSVRCTRAITAPPAVTTFWAWDFESASNLQDGGMRTDKKEPFCGGWSLLNPYWIYRYNKHKKAIYVPSYPHFCMAYRAASWSSIALNYTYSDPSGKQYVHRSRFDPNFIRDKRWRYRCIDLSKELKKKHPDGANFRIYDINFDRIMTLKNMNYIDSIYFGSVPTTTDPKVYSYRRKSLRKLFRVKEVKVEQDQARSWKLSILPHDCKHGLKKFTLRNAQTTTYDVNRVAGASLPIQGTFDINWNGLTLKGVPVESTLDELKATLESLPGMGSLAVTQTDNCDSYLTSVTWLTHAGNQPEMTVTNKQITGTNPQVTIITTLNGQVMYKPITGDMLRTPHNKPQVMAYINKITTACSGTCEFTWSDAATPELATVTPNTGTAGTELTLTGKRFDATTITNNVVTIGDAACTAKSASAEQFRCMLADGAAGVYPISLNVLGLGSARLPNGAISFTYNLQVSSFTPDQGSIAGGTKLTLIGRGFSKDTTVTIDAKECDQISWKHNEFVCETPYARMAQNAPYHADVVVKQASQTLTASQRYLYAPASTPKVTAIDSSMGLVDGTKQITISGTGFGNKNGSVKIGHARATVVSFSDTEIKVILPGLAAGAYPLRVHIPDQGFANTAENNIPDITYTFKVTSMTPTSCSLYGGARVTLTGQGFSSTNALNTIHVGRTVCVPVTSTYYRVECQLDWTTTVHNVRNNGSSKRFGQGYAWDTQVLELTVGDKVRWVWQRPSFARTVGFLVNETVNASATVPKEGGFSSGSAKTGSGVFEHTFITSGTYYYWSGPVNSDGNIIMRGVVNVAEKTSFSAALVFRIGQQVAAHVTGSTGRRKRASSCPDVTQPIPNCSENPNANGQFQLLFQKCQTARVTSISPLQGTTRDSLVIKGVGFGSQNCQNDVTIGDYNCVVQSSSTTEITCKIDAKGAMPIKVPHRVGVSVRGRGYAFVDIILEKNRQFVLQPEVNTLSPTAGSIKGGTKLTLTGSAFSKTEGGNVVLMNTLRCDIVSQSYTQIVCTTPIASGPGIADLKVYVSGTQTVCSGVCVYTYDNSMTPEVSSVTPASITGPGNTLTITGSGFVDVTSSISVTVGGVSCALKTASATSVTCGIDGVPLGNNQMMILVSNKGYADSSKVKVVGTASITSVSPGQGSLNGGTKIEIKGNGFKSGATRVTIGGTACAIESQTVSSVVCSTPAHAKGNADVIVESSGTTYAKQSFTYSESSTPTVTSISPASGHSGDTVTISGSGYSSVKDENSVIIGSAACIVTSSTSTQIVCTTRPYPAGSADVTVNVAGKGLATTSSKFEYIISVTSIAPTEGSLGGGQVLTVTGSGLTSTTTATVCGQACPVTSSTAAELKCLTPAKTGAAGSCDVIVSYGTKVITRPNMYIYKDSLTATITKVTPNRGGTGGGTEITITGTKFGSDQSKVTVSIAGSPCQITSFTDTEVKCRTGSHRPPIKSKVALKIEGKGLATQDNAAFQYVDVWSSRYTWGGQNPPKEGDFVVVPAEQVLVIDVDTPIIKMLLIKGGQVIFDEKDVELKAENIMITEGGVLQIGTEGAPHQHKAIITLYGHIRQSELPIYGAKTLAVRNGRLDLHGQPRVPWTVLDQTATAGQRVIKLQNPVDWSPGDSVVVASTGGHNSQAENEKVQIASIATDKKTVTLTEDLKYNHIGLTQTFSGGVSLETRAEVGLLTRNIVVRGYNHPQWNDKIPKCPGGFDTGQFATQTCFEGRFGEEIGSDQYGAAIMIHTKKPDSLDEAQVRIEYVELTYMGQAYRLGRYPVHFHINGDMTGTYVRGAAIHNTFNRAINIHNSHNILIEHNVVYDVMGGAIFLEDGIEHGNVFQYNAVIFVKTSSSLLNDDITPASFWITNPNNTVQHNHAAGGTHFGFWYRMNKHPDGPSYDPSICPRKIPLLVFNNNTVHSVGWYGLWVFEFYTPMKGGLCSSKEPEPAKFTKLTVWNAFRGAEWGECGAIQFHDMVLANNYMAGIEMLFIRSPPGTDPVPKYSPDGAMLKNNVIIGELTHAGRPPCTRKGLVLPFSNGLLIDGLKFINFKGTNHHKCSGIGTVKIICTCDTICAGWNYQFKNIGWYDADQKSLLEWEHNGEFHDIDGTFSGTASGATVVASSGLYPASKCSPAPDFSMQFPASVCTSDVSFVRFGFNNPEPESLLYKNVTIQNANGVSVLPWMKKRETYASGWLAILASGFKYTMKFDNAEHISNFSYAGAFSGVDAGEHVVVSVNTTQKRDFVQILKAAETNQSSAPLSYNSNGNGDWYWNDPVTSVEYIISNPTPEVAREETVHVRSIDCFFKNCKAPPDPSTTPPDTARPANADYWSQTSTWKNADPGWGGSDGKLPKDGDKVKIVQGFWVVTDIPLPVMEKVEIYGTLELDNEPDKDGKQRDYTLKTKYLIIQGRLIVGWEDKPFIGQVQIILQGTHATPEFPRTNGPSLGSKVIGVFGGLDLHGQDRAVVWTRLSATAEAGANVISVLDAVDWKVGETVMITSTSYSAWQTEKFEITIVSADKKTLTLNKNLAYRHLAVTDTLGGEGKPYTIAAEVALLSRNVKVIGEEYPDLQKESFGARIIVGTRLGEDDLAYTGYARISNVEFRHSGQEGYVAHYDPRFSLAFLSTGTVSHVKPSYVLKNTFHDGFATAIGVFGASGMNVSGNVIHRTVGSAMIIEGARHQLRGNLISLVIWSGAYNGRREPGNMDSVFGMELQDAVDIVLQENTVAGSERGGYRTDGEKCSAPPGEDRWHRNVAHSMMTAVVMTPKDCHREEADKCSKLSGFYVYRSWIYGIYVQTECTVILENSVLVDNRVNFFPMAIKSGLHVYDDQHIRAQNLQIVGQSPSLDCAKDFMSSSDPNVAGLLYISSWYVDETNERGRIGIAWPAFASRDNMMPKKPWNDYKGFPALLGGLHVNNVTFARFQKSCGTGTHDRCFTTNPLSRDLGNPIIVKNIKLIDVADEAKVFIQRPDVTRISGGMCGDLDCDGKKRAMLSDKDGGFLGQPGTVIPHSEFEWGGDRRRGLGDYRIPKTMLTDTDGKRLDVNTVAPHKGVWRGDCTYKSSWQAYECRSQRYLMLALETMDEDTLTRRAAPVAVLCEKYVDIINGPKDKGICGGYACNRRLSLYRAILPEGKYSQIHYTGTTPQHIRLFLMDSEPNQRVLISVFYTVQQRIDVYYNGTYVLPKNGKIDAKGNFLYTAPTGPPAITEHPGANMFDVTDTRELYVVLIGPLPVDIKLRPVVIVDVRIPAISTEEFYGKNIIDNLARFLKVKPGQIRTVRAVSETPNTPSVRKRRGLRAEHARAKRATSTLMVQLEIADAPVKQINMTTDGQLTYEQLTFVMNSLVEGVQTGSLEKYLNLTFSSFKILEPVPPSASTSWANYTVEYSGKVVNPVKVVIPDALRLVDQPYGKQEGSKFTTQPKLAIVDIQGQTVIDLRAASGTWKVTATLKNVAGHPQAALMGTTTVPIVSGWANFTDLAISHSGAQYAIDFEVTGLSVTAPESMKVTSQTFGLGSRLLASRFVTSSDTTYTVNQPFDVNIEIIDALTKEKVNNLAWRGHSWTCQAATEIPSPTVHEPTINGVPANVSFDRSSGLARVSGLKVNIEGRASLSLRIVSTPAEYDVTSYDSVTLVRADYIKTTVEVTRKVGLTFDAEFDKTVIDKERLFAASLYNTLLKVHRTVTFNDFAITRGSIKSSFTVSGPRGEVDQELSKLWSAVKSGLVVPFYGHQITTLAVMTVDEQLYPPAKATGNTMLVVMIVVPIVFLLLVIAIVAALVYRAKKRKVVNKDTLYNSPESSRHSPAPEVYDTTWKQGDLKPETWEPTGYAPSPPAGTTFLSTSLMTKILEKQNGRRSPSVAPEPDSRPVTRGEITTSLIATPQFPSPPQSRKRSESTAGLPSIQL